MEKSIGTQEHDALTGLLRNARLAAGLSQAQLAALLKTTASAISSIEAGQRRLDLVELEIYVRTLGIALPRFVEVFWEEVVRIRQRDAEGG